eukprot:9346-Heterococcus_DN1.PRE.2
MQCSTVLTPLQALQVIEDLCKRCPIVKRGSQLEAATYDLSKLLPAYINSCVGTQAVWASPIISVEDNVVQYFRIGTVTRAKHVAFAAEGLHVVRETVGSALGNSDAGTLHVFKGDAYTGLDYSKLRPTDRAQLQSLIDQAQTVLKQSGNTHGKKLTQIADDLWHTVVQCLSYALVTQQQCLQTTAEQPTALYILGYAKCIEKSTDYAVFVACMQLLRHVSELASTILNDASNDVHAVVRKDKARACVLAVIIPLRNILVDYSLMNASDALAVAHYIARPTSLRNTTLWHQWLTSAANDRLTAAAAMNTTAVSSGNSVTTRNMDNIQAASTAAAAAANTTVDSTLTATITASRPATASTATASTTAAAGSSSAIASQDPNVTALATATAEKLKDRVELQLQRIAVLEQQLQDTLHANAAAVAAKKQQYAQIQQQEREKYAALLQQLEHDQQNQHQRVQIEAMQLVKQLTGSL